MWYNRKGPSSLESETPLHMSLLENMPEENSDNN